MKLAVLVSSYERSSSPFRDVDVYPDPSLWVTGHQFERFLIDKATAVRQVRELARRGFDAFICLCDGLWEEDRAGIDVVIELERLGVAYTGARQHFFETSRRALKLACSDAQVDTPNHVFAISDRDVAQAAEALRFPLLVKPMNGYGSLGLEPVDRVERAEDLWPRIAAKIAEFGGALIEEFVVGAEYTVLVAEPGHGETTPKTWRPMEIIFPAGESFMHFELKWKNFTQLELSPVTDPVVSERLMHCARRIFRALNGSGYARVDLRVDENGRIFILDVNSQPCAFYPPGLNPLDLILTTSPGGHQEFIDHLLRCAFARRERQRARWRLMHDPLKGYGIAACRDFDPGERIVVLEETARRFVSRQHVDRHWEDWEKTVFGQSAVALSDNIFRIWSANPDEWYPFNHACEPNAVFDGLDIVAWRPIVTGQPITVEYATFAGPDLTEFTCYCGAPTCRGTVRGSDALAPWVEERYGRRHLTDYVLMIRARAANHRACDAISPRPGALTIRPSPGKGRGVFAESAVAKGEIVEICPVIVLSEIDRAEIDKTALYNYYYEWGSDYREAALALGYGSLYNHSYQPNAHFIRYLDRQAVEIYALRDIPPGEEITINYHGEPNNQEPLWFTPTS